MNEYFSNTLSKRIASALTRKGQTPIDGLEPAKPIYVSVYSVVRRYGGPEEGGWWWNDKQLVHTKKFFDQDEADKYQKALEQHPQIQEANQESLSSIRGFEHLPEDEGSASYPEGYIPTGFGGDAENYNVVQEETPGESETKETPHYE